MPLQSTSGAASYDAFGGGVAAVPKYIEDYFSTFLYTGTGSAQTITNGIDLSTKGGLTWIKRRDATGNHNLFDTARGATKKLYSDLTNAEYTDAFSLTSFNSNGFSVGVDVSGTDRLYASWSWAKAPKFFDVVTYTGNGTSGRTIAHNLGSAPGFMVVKVTSTTDQWCIYHRSQGATKYGLFTTAAFDTYSGTWNNTEPTSTVFTVGNDAFVNANGATYVAYLFAHDAGGFGLTGTDNVISCGSFTTDGSGNFSVNLGYEPQWVMIKSTNNTGVSAAQQNWIMMDNMRGFVTQSGTGARLRANTSEAESTTNDFGPTATGFESLGNMSASAPFIYIAIRRGPMKVPTSGTSVFAPVAYTGNGTDQSITTGITGDLTYIKYRTDSGAGNFFFDRLRNPKAYLESNSTAAEVTGTQHITAFNQLGFSVGNNGNVNDSGGTFISQTFRRAPSFFDEVCYTGTGNNPLVLNHNLGVPPELIIIKKRVAIGSATNWYCGANFTSSTYTELLLNSDGGGAVYNYPNWFVSAPTATTFDLNGGGNVNSSGATAVAYLFATCSGVSKVFSYTGNGSSQTINCGFTGGARFVLIKRTDSTGDWYVWDSARGIVSGNDPHLSLNSTAAEVTSNDTIDTDSTGFVVNQVSATNVNVSSATYIGIAIA